MLDVIMTALLFLVTVGFLVAVHELGHLLAGRLCGIMPEAFSVGMGRDLVAHVDRNGTIWRIGAVPLGGYVRFPDGPMAASSPWQRLFIFAAGPLANLILAVLLFAAMVATQPNTSFPPTIATLAAESPEGLRVGDTVLTVDSIPLSNAANLELARREAGQGGRVRYGALRGNATLVLFDAPLASPTVLDVLPGSIGERAGLRVGDRILSINGQPAYSVADLVAPSADNTIRSKNVVVLGVDGFQRDLQLPAGHDGQSMRLGISGKAAVVFETNTAFNPGLWLREGVGRTYAAVTLTWNVLADLIAGKTDSCVISGPMGMAENVKGAFDRGITIILAMGAVLSLGLGIFNLLPLPVLDGGQIMVASYAGLFRQEPSIRAYAYLNILGSLIIGLVMVFAILNDIRC